MKAIKRFVTLIILIIAFGAAVYTQRVQVSDWLTSLNKPVLPEPVSYEEKTAEVPKKLEEPVVKKMADFDEGIQKALSSFSVLEEVKDAVVPVDEEIEEPTEEVVGELVKEVVAEEKKLEVAVNLGVPFTSQAPHANWGFPYKEACEEASVFMVQEFFKGTPDGKIAPKVADEGLLKIVEFQKELFGFYEDTDLSQTRTFAELLYGFEKIEIVDNPTVEQIKQFLRDGLPVIVPAAGRELGNPNFTAPGPVYHMLVIRGFTADGKFITNDPGTRNGEAYVYEEDVLMNAIHDWNGTKDINSGKKSVMIIYPN
jgi:hypothetical protein